MHVCLCMCVTVCVHLWIGVRRIHVKCAVQCVCGQSEHHFELCNCHCGEGVCVHSSV